jgi:hypothetical protein
MPEEDVYRCPAGETLKFYYANEEHGQKMRRYWTNACKTCAIKDQCTTGKERLCVPKTLSGLVERRIG